MADSIFDPRLPVVTELPDGSSLFCLAQPGTRGRGKRIPVTRHRVHPVGIDLRASAQGRRGLPAGHHHPRPRRRPGRDLAELYAQRWEIEWVFDGIKTHQFGARSTLCSRDPNGAE